jgi:hypothetical protein
MLAPYVDDGDYLFLHDCLGGELREQGEALVPGMTAYITQVRVDECPTICFCSESA